MKRDYEEYVTRFRHSFIPIKVEAEKYLRISAFVDRLIAAKAGESHHQIDNTSEKKRFMTELLGEAALEQLLGIDIIDWTIGDSSTYHHPDIPNYRVGIKTVERGKFPIVFKDNYYPQIICVRSIHNDDVIFVCGLATKEVLNRYQDDDLIIDPNLRARGTKTGFYGFEQLIPVRSLEQLAAYKK